MAQLARHILCLASCDLQPGSCVKAFPVVPPFCSGPFRLKARLVDLGVDSPLFSAIVLFKNQPFPQGSWWFSGKKDPWEVSPRVEIRFTSARPPAGAFLGFGETAVGGGAGAQPLLGEEEGAGGREAALLHHGQAPSAERETKSRSPSSGPFPFFSLGGGKGNYPYSNLSTGGPGCLLVSLESQPTIGTINK